VSIAVASSEPAILKKLTVTLNVARKQRTAGYIKNESTRSLNDEDKMTTLREAFDEFLLAGQANGLSSESTRSYKGLLLPFVRDTGEESLLIAVDKSYMRQYIVGLRERKSVTHSDRKLSTATIDTYIRNLKIFWKWAAAEYGIENPMATIALPKRRKAMPKSIEPRNFIKLFNATDASKSGQRDRAILALFADTGARRSGILSLNIEHVTNGIRRAWIFEKGEWRWIYWTYATQQLIEQWVVNHPKLKGALFINLATQKRLTGNGMYQITQRLKRRAGVQGRANPHSFRHNFARVYLMNGGDVITLARLLGHKNTDMLRDFYAIFSADELAVLHAENSPLLAMLEEVA
jgi:site-specific recombinase XerD